VRVGDGLVFILFVGLSGLPYAGAVGAAVGFVSFVLERNAFARVVAGGLLGVGALVVGRAWLGPFVTGGPVSGILGGGVVWWLSSAAPFGRRERPVGILELGVERQRTLR
jgi:hypothetical protein